MGKGCFSLKKQKCDKIHSLDCRVFINPRRTRTLDGGKDIGGKQASGTKALRMKQTQGEKRREGMNALRILHDLLLPYGGSARTDALHAFDLAAEGGLRADVFSVPEAGKTQTANDGFDLVVRALQRLVR